MRPGFRFPDSKNDLWTPMGPFTGLASAPSAGVTASAEVLRAVLGQVLRQSAAGIVAEAVIPVCLSLVASSRRNLPFITLRASYRARINPRFSSDESRELRG